jgi:hypothetical protein
MLAEDQPEYETLPIHVSNTPQRECTACFELSPEELAEVQRTGRIWYTQLTFGNPFQPIRMSVLYPFAPPDVEG